MTKAKAKTDKTKEVNAAVSEPIGAAAPIKKVAIVGCSDTKGLAPYDDSTWEIWAMNNAYGHVKRPNAWFEIHPIKFEKGKYWRRKLIQPGIFEWSNDFRGIPMEKYMESLARLDCIVYMQQHWDNIPKSEPYPLAEIIKKFGRYFTNSVSFMIALAIDQGYAEIGCYGVDMATTSEYGPQRPSCEFFLGVAAGLGRIITIPDQSDLLKTKFLYGFEEREQYAWEKKMVSTMQALETRKQKAIAQFELANKQTQQYVGAQEMLREIQKLWSNLADTKIWADPV